LTCHSIPETAPVEVVKIYGTRAKSSGSCGHAI
jgi:hypothetical protein